MTDAIDRSRWTIWAEDRLRYGDTDRQGHINNAVYATFFETGRVAILYDPEAPLASPGTAFVIAKLTIEFRSEANWPGVVHIGTAVRSLGRSSVTFDQIVLQDGRPVATAESVIVLMDETTRRSTPMPEATRARLAALAPSQPEPTPGHHETPQP